MNFSKQKNGAVFTFYPILHLKTQPDIIRKKAKVLGFSMVGFKLFFKPGLDDLLGSQLVFYIIEDIDVKQHGLIPVHSVDDHGDCRTSLFGKQ